MQIRQIENKDFADVVRLGSLMHKESRYHDFNFDFDKCFRLLAYVKEAPKEWCCFVAENAEKELIGVFIGYANSHPFGNDVIASDFILYLLPEHRGGTIAVRLIKKFEAWAKELGVKEIVLGVSTEVNVERTSKLYERLGYAAKGHTFMKGV